MSQDEKQLPVKRTPSDSIAKAMAVAGAAVAVVFVITFLAGGLLAFLHSIVKSLQGENRSIFQTAAFAIVGILFIVAFLAFNVAPLFVTTVSCGFALEELSAKSPRPRHVSVAVVVMLLSAVLVWVFLPWLQHFPARVGEWSANTGTIYRWVYVIENVAVGCMFAAKAGAPKKLPVQPVAAPETEGA